jgi:SAM-dependent methyltransferase
MRHSGPVDEAGLVATGERTGPGLPDEEYWFARHEVAYHWVAQRVAHARIVVDAGAGEGYGAAMLSSARYPAIAVEYDTDACVHMRHTYPQIAVAQANLAALPVRTASTDAITCLQVVEHLWDLAGFLRDCVRCLRSGGELIITTPQRLTFSPGLGRGVKPINPFHVEEFDAEQLRDLLFDAGFAEVDMRGIHHGPRLTAWETRHGSIVSAQVTASLEGTWPEDLRDTISQVTVDDFVVDAEPVAAEGTRMAQAQDLLAIARVSA